MQTKICFWQTLYFYRNSFDIFDYDITSHVFNQINYFVKFVIYQLYFNVYFIYRYSSTSKYFNLSKDLSSILGLND